MAKYDTVIVWADFMASGLWIPNPMPNFPHATLAIHYDSIGVPEALADRFRAWIDWYWGVYDHPEIFDIQEFNKEGADLAAELQLFLGRPHESGTLVLFRPEMLRTPEQMKKYYRASKDE